MEKRGLQGDLIAGLQELKGPVVKQWHRLPTEVVDVPGDIPGQIGQDSEKLALVEDGLAHYRRIGVTGLPTQSIL